MSVDVGAVGASRAIADAQTDVPALVDRAVTFLRSLGATQTRWTIGTVLASWRLAERDLAAATPGSVAWTHAMERFVLARAEYHRLFADAVSQAGDLRRTW